MGEIAKCPNPECGYGHKAIAVRIASFHYSRVQVRCECGYQGPDADEGIDAIRLHNLICRPVALEQLVEKWIPCSERMPENLQPVLIAHLGKTVHGWYDEPEDAWDIEDEDYFVNRIEVTHWMPLPASPDELAACIKGGES